MYQSTKSTHKLNIVLSDTDAMLLKYNATAHNLSRPEYVRKLIRNEPLVQYHYDKDAAAEMLNLLNAILNEITCISYALKAQAHTAYDTQYDQLCYAYGNLISLFCSFLIAI